jgi:hypothetical protein
LKIIVNLHTQNNSKTKVIRGLHLFCQREASKQIIAKQIKKDEKGTHPENYRLVVLKTF